MIIDNFHNLFDSIINGVCGIPHVMNHHVQEYLGIGKLFFQLPYFPLLWVHGATAYVRIA